MPVSRLPFWRRQRVAVEPVGRGSRERDEGTDDAQVHVGGAGRRPAAGELETAVDVVGEGRGDEREDEHDGDEADDEPQPRQGEDEEADVEPELRVVDAERLAVDPEQERAPGPHRAGPGEEPEDDGDDDDRDPAQRLDGLAVLLEHLLGGRHRDVEGPRAVGRDEAGGDGAAGEQGGDDEDRELGRSSLMKTSRKPTESYHQTSVRTSAAMPPRTKRPSRTTIVVPSGPRRRRPTGRAGPLGPSPPSGRGVPSPGPMGPSNHSERLTALLVPSAGWSPCRPWTGNVPRAPARPSGTMVR